MLDGYDRTGNTPGVKFFYEQWFHFVRKKDENKSLDKSLISLHADELSGFNLRPYFLFHII